MTKVRGFEKVKKEIYDELNLEIAYEDLTLPSRGTRTSAGYDFISPISFTLNPGERIVVPTGIKAYMQDTEVLIGFARSGVGFKYEVQFANLLPVIDADYYSNPSNDGLINFKLVNRGDKPWEVKAGDRIVQCIFMPYLLVDGDSVEEGTLRTGGHGHTGK